MKPGPRDTASAKDGGSLKILACECATAALCLVRQQLDHCAPDVGFVSTDVGK